MCHLDHQRQFLTKIIGCVIWILMLQEAVTTPNESNQNPKPNYQVRRDPYVGKSPHRKSRNILCLITTLFVKKNMMISRTQQVRGDPYVDQNPQSVACWHLNMLKKIKKVRWDPYWWIKKRNAKLISEFQDCRMQLWRKQNISEFNQELVHRIENHLHREAFHADLQKNNVYNPIQQKFKGDDPRIG